MTSFAAVVPATNAPSTLHRCLAAITSASEPPDELIVVREPTDVGPAAARNLGASRSTADVLVFVDADVLVAPDAFTRIREHYRRDPSLTAVFGAYDDALGTDALVARFRNLLHHHVHARAAGPATTFWAGIGAVRRNVFEHAGGFDHERYPRPSIEDLELGIRLADAGATIVLDPSIRGTHLKEWSVAQMLRTDFAARGVPWVRLLLERREAPTTLNLGWRERASAAAALLVAGSIVRRKPLAAAASAGALVALNRPFYGLLARRLGVGRAAACVPLHVAHHLAGTAAVPVGLVCHLRARRHGDVELIDESS